jgi:hypothetical protein
MYIYRTLGLKQSTQVINGNHILNEGGKQSWYVFSTQSDFKKLFN